MVGVSASVVMRTVRRGASRKSRDGGGPEYHCARGNKPVQLVSEHCVPFGDGGWWLMRVSALHSPDTSLSESFLKVG